MQLRGAAATGNLPPILGSPAEGGAGSFGKLPSFRSWAEATGSGSETSWRAERKLAWLEQDDCSTKTTLPSMDETTRKLTEDDEQELEKARKLPVGKLGYCLSRSQEIDISSWLELPSDKHAPLKPSRLRPLRLRPQLAPSRPRGAPDEAASGSASDSSSSSSESEDDEPRAASLRATLGVEASFTVPVAPATRSPTTQSFGSASLDDEGRPRRSPLAARYVRPDRRTVGAADGRAPGQCGPQEQDGEQPRA